MPKKSQSGYWKEFYPLWMAEICLLLGWTDWFQAMIKTALPLGGIWFTLWLTGDLENLIGSIAYELGRGLVLISLIFLIMFITYMRASNKLYDNQEKEKKFLNDKIESYEAKPVDVDFKFSEWEFSEEAPIIAPTVFDGYTQPSNMNKMVGVRVQIPKGENVWCYAIFTSLVRINSDGSRNDLLREATRNSPLISWSGGGANEAGEVLIKDGGDRVLNVAEGVNQDLIFRLLNLNFRQNSNGLYVFGVGFGGRISDKKIKSKTAYFHIIYDTSTTAMDGYEEYTPESFRKLEIKKGKPSATLTKKKKISSKRSGT